MSVAVLCLALTPVSAGTLISRTLSGIVVGGGGGNESVPMSLLNLKYALQCLPLHTLVDANSYYTL